jgi:hypothetical protein
VLILWLLTLAILSFPKLQRLSTFCGNSPREGNAQVDYLSKIIDYEDWGVSEMFFNFMNELWGIYTIDRNTIY